MKNIFKILSLIFISIHGYSQNSLSGYVLNKTTQEKIPGAVIYFPDLKTGTISDANGQYLIKGLPEGKFLVLYKMLGYQSRTLQLIIKGETIQDAELETSAIEAQEVTVTGTSQSTELKENPLSISTINQQSLFQNTSTNLIDNISKKPGINQISTGAAISKPVIRGLGYNRVVTLNNGIRQEGQQWGDEHGIEIDEFSVDRVEVIKGPGSLMYGSDAIAGVINFLPMNPLPEGQVKLNVLSNYQTNNHLQAYSLMNAGNIKGVNWLLRGSMKQAGNYRNAYDGYVYNSGFKEYDVNGSFGINRSWGYSHVYFSSFDQTIAMTEGERDSLGRFIKQINLGDTAIDEVAALDHDLKGYRYDVPRQRVTHRQISNTTKWYLNQSSIMLNLAYQQNNRREYGNVLVPDETDIFLSLNTLNYDLRYQLPELKGWNMSVGVGGMQQTNATKGKEAIIPSYQLFDAGGYFFLKKELTEKISFSGGLRLDHRSMKTEALYVDSLDQLSQLNINGNMEKFKSYSKTFQAVTGSAGLAYVINKNWSLKLNAARGFRAPNASEIAANGRHEGTIRYEIGNVNLKPETSWQGDLGVILNTDHISAEFSVFYNDIQNYIYAQKLKSQLGGDSISDPIDPAPSFKFVQGHAFLYGGEFSFEIHPHPLDWLHIENAFSMVNAEQLSQPDSMRYLPFIPAPRYQGEIRCEWKQLTKYLKGIYLSLSVNHYFEQNRFYSAFGTETKTPAYTLLNAGIGSDLVNKKDQCVLKWVIQINNMTDVAYQNHMSRLKYAAVNPVTNRTGVFAMGRNISFKILIPVDWSIK